MFSGVLIQGALWDLLAKMSLVAWIILMILVIMSFGTWAIVINKWRLFKAAEADSRRFFSTFRRRTNLREAHSKCLNYRATPLAGVFEEGFREWEAFVSLKTEGKLSQAGTVKLAPDELDAIDRILEKEANEQLKKFEKNIGFLATSATSAPFIGLLGTCYGIMVAFMNIGIQESASLVVVAPGIAEALIATIVGLAVAIPSVMAYNWATVKLRFMTDDLRNFAQEFLAAVTREQTNGT